MRPFDLIAFDGAGFHERSERFTVSGLPNDVPVTYGEWRRRIIRDSLVTLGSSARRTR